MLAVLTTGLGHADAGAGSPVPGRQMALAVRRWAGERAALVRVVGLGCAGRSVGSGVVVGDGRVLTNRHVVAGAAYVEVQRVDGTRIGASVERVGETVDLAVLWAGDALGPGVVPAGRLAVHQPVTLLGHPRGGPAAGTSGPVTARATFDQPGMRAEAAWVDAEVSEGNSGGPAFDETGRLVGVVFARERHTGLAGVIDGDTAAAFLGGAGPSGDPAVCEDERRD
jgi:S1-C subfamily serine protease